MDVVCQLGSGEGTVKGEFKQPQNLLLIHFYAFMQKKNKKKTEILKVRPMKY